MAEKQVNNDGLVPGQPVSYEEHKRLLALRRRAKAKAASQEAPDIETALAQVRG